MCKYTLFIATRRSGCHTTKTTQIPQAQHILRRKYERILLTLLINYRQTKIQRYTANTQHRTSLTLQCTYTCIEEGVVGADAE